MTNHIIAEIQAVVDRLHGMGHVEATRLENALRALEAHFKHDAGTVKAEAEADAKKVEADAKPVEAEVKADAAKLAGDAKATIESDLAEAADLAGLKK